MYECTVCGARLTKKCDTHSPKAVWIGQPFIPCPGALIEVPGNVLIDGFLMENFDRAACLDSGMPSRDMVIGQFRAR